MFLAILVHKKGFVETEVVGTVCCYVDLLISSQSALQKELTYHVLTCEITICNKIGIDGSKRLDTPLVI